MILNFYQYKSCGEFFYLCLLFIDIYNELKDSYVFKCMLLNNGVQYWD